MLTKVLKWGNSLAVRIPKAFAREINITEHSRVNLTLEEGKINIEPVPKDLAVHLDDLIGQVNESNIHYEIDSGKPRGKEVW